MQNLQCAVCKGPCPTTPLTGKAPANVLDMFKGASVQLKSLNKILSWQESQKQSIKEYQELEVQRLEEKAKKQQDALVKLEGRLEEKRVQVKNLEKEEAELKSQISMCLSGAVSGCEKDRRSSKHDHNSSVEFVRDGKCSKPKTEDSSRQLQSTKAEKLSGRGGSHGQGPLSSAFYKGMATYGPSDKINKNDSSFRSGASARNNSLLRHFPSAGSN